jgi:hypothetical protein
VKGKLVKVKRKKMKDCPKSEKVVMGRLVF